MYYIFFTADIFINCHFFSKNKNNYGIVVASAQKFMFALFTQAFTLLKADP